MTIAAFNGFGGVRLEADIVGDANDPTILLVHGVGQTRSVWATVAEGLVQSGRRVVNLDLRGHGRSEWPSDGRYDHQALVEDLRAVLAQLDCRPVVVAATMSGWMAIAALADDAALLAAGLVLIDLPSASEHALVAPDSRQWHALLAQTQDGSQWDPRVPDSFGDTAALGELAGVAGSIAIPLLLVDGGLSSANGPQGRGLVEAFRPGTEFVSIAENDLQLATDRAEALLTQLLDFFQRKQPRAANEFRAGSDARTLRDALGCFATGVTIVTARSANGIPVGLTANSFTSVSLDPPLLLVCIANGAGSAVVLRDADCFAVNVLQMSQQAASNRFAGRNEDRFAQTEWEIGETGTPLITGSLGSFECKRHAIHEGGDHFILVGEVVRARYEPRRDPLLYFRGKYRRLHFA